MPRITNDDTDGNKLLSQDLRKYFHPTAQFERWMKAHYAKKHICEIGAGVGHVAKLLAESGLRVTAIDLEPKAASEFNVIKADSTTYPYDKNAVAMLCRPCHEDGFVRKTILRALNSGVRTVIYVGLHRNVRQDLGGYYREFTKRRIKGIGHADERIWELRISRVQASANLRRGTIPPL